MTIRQNRNGKKPGHKKQEESPARHRDNTVPCNSSWKWVVEFDRVRRTELDMGRNQDTDRGKIERR